MAVVINSGKEEKKTPGKKTWLLAVIIAILAVAGAFAGWKAVSLWSDYKAADAEYDNLQANYTRIDLDAIGGWDPDENSGNLINASQDGRVPGIPGIDFPDLGIDHAALYEINPDYMGWIWINDMISDIHVSYPILQSEDNEDYLHHTMEGTYNSAGSIFVDYNTPGDFSEHHTILYGHNMFNGSMFGALKRYSGTAEISQERYFYIFLRDGSVLKCRLFSTHIVSKTSTVYQIDMSDNLYREFFPRVLAESEDDWGADVLVPDNIPEKTVTLSTCYGSSGTNRRTAVHAYVDTWFVDRSAIIPDLSGEDVENIDGENTEDPDGEELEDSVETDDESEAGENDD